MIMRMIWALRRIKFKIFSTFKKKNGKVRLHLGCGSDYWPGYVNVDISPNSLRDLQMDFTKIKKIYPANSVREVALIHSLSYLRLWQARDLFADLYRILEPGGVIVIELPDLSKCAQKALQCKKSKAEYLEAVRGLYAFDMEQIERKEMFTPYAFGWSSWHLEQELEKVGFRNITISDPQTHGRRIWRDTRIEAIK
jgi:predicted SAM-dependent methyltransferase